jgi:hypothetical protein
MCRFQKQSLNALVDPALVTDESHVVEEVTTDLHVSALRNMDRVDGAGPETFR